MIMTSIQAVLASESIMCTSAVCMGHACGAYCARWSRSSSCLCRLVCRAHAAACRPSMSSCPWQVGPCPSSSASLQDKKAASAIASNAGSQTDVCRLSWCTPLCLRNSLDRPPSWRGRASTKEGGGVHISVHPAQDGRLHELLICCLDQVHATHLLSPFYRAAALHSGLAFHCLKPSRLHFDRCLNMVTSRAAAPSAAEEREAELPRSVRRKLGCWGNAVLPPG